jgi:hypothetical protein
MCGLHKVERADSSLMPQLIELREIGMARN